MLHLKMALEILSVWGIYLIAVYYVLPTKIARWKHTGRFGIVLFFVVLLYAFGIGSPNETLSRPWLFAFGFVISAFTLTAAIFYPPAALKTIREDGFVGQLRAFWNTIFIVSMLSLGYIMMVGYPYFSPDAPRIHLQHLFR